MYCDLAYITWLHRGDTQAGLEDELGVSELNLKTWDYFRENYKTLFKLPQDEMNTFTYYPNVRIPFHNIELMQKDRIIRSYIEKYR